MAVLFYSPQLSLRLEDARERQKNGDSYVIGAGVPVTKELYDEVYKMLSKVRAFKKRLRRITYHEIQHHLSWARMQRGTIKVTPRIEAINGGSITVVLPFYIPGANGQEIEQVLEKCIGKSGFQYSHDGIVIELAIKTILNKSRLYDLLEKPTDE